MLHCNGNIILEKPLDFMHCVASRFGYSNYRLSELSLVPISSVNRRSTVVEDYTYIGIILTNKNEFRPETEKRITKENREYYALPPVLQSQTVLRVEKIKV